MTTESRDLNDCQDCNGTGSITVSTPTFPSLPVACAKCEGSGLGTPWKGVNRAVATLAHGANFYPQWTGGGCTALEFTFTNACYLLITDHDGASIPATVYESVLLGFYDENGEQIACDSFPSLRAALTGCEVFTSAARLNAKD